MANYEVHYNLEYIDKNGDTAVVRMPLRLADTTTVAVLISGLDAFDSAMGAPGTITNATRLRKSLSIFSAESDPSVTPALDAEFPSVADKAKLQFVSGLSGAKYQLAIPAPIEGIFAAPPADDTVNSGSAVSAAIAFVQAHATDVGGNLFGVYTTGSRTKSRARRRKTHRG